MSEAAKTARDAMRSKAKRLTSTDPHEKVDSSSWTPPEAENAGVQTGARPLVKRLYKKGGKVVGKAEGKKAAFRADRKPRKAGGKVEHKAPWVDDLINRDVRMANDKREGVKHEGGFKKGGKARASGGKLGKYINKAMENYGNAPNDPKNKQRMTDGVQMAVSKISGTSGAKIPATRKSGGRTHKFGGGMMGNNPVSQQNEMMGKAAGMMKKGGKVHREDGGKTPAKVPMPPRRYEDADVKGMSPQQIQELMYGSDPYGSDRTGGAAPKKHGGKADGHKVNWLHHAKGGKAAHSDEAQDKKLMHKILKEKAFKASGGSMHHEDCSCKKCWGGRTGKYAGGGVFEGNSTTKIPGVVGGREAHAKGGPSVRSQFNDAFRNARNQGLDMFEFNGKTYNTKMFDPSKTVGSGRGISGPTANQISPPTRMGGTPNYQQPQTTYMPGIRQGGANEPAIVVGSPSSAMTDPSSYAERENQFIRQQEQRARDSMNAANNSDLTPRAGQRPIDFSEMASGLTPEQSMPRKSGGRAKGKTNVNIVIATGKGQQPMGMLGGAPMENAPVSPRIPQQAGMPPQGMPPMPPQGGMPPMPPQGPMPRKSGGRAYPIDTGAGGANARLEKIDAYGLKPTKRK